MRIFVGILLGIVIGALVVWYYQGGQHRAQPAKLGDQLKESTESARDAIASQWKKLNPDDIKNELARTGRVIRENAHAAGQGLADATADARITALVKTKLAADSGLSSLSVSVNTTEGTVTLAGSVPTAEHVAKAISIAQDVDGVTKVISTLQIKPG